MNDKFIMKGKGKSRIEVNVGELLMLNYLEKHHLLSTEQLFKCYTKIYLSEIHPYAFKNRLRKFEEFKLVRSSNFAEGFDGERFKYYTIGTAGIDLLIKEKLLSDDYNKNRIYHRLNKKNVLHFLMTQEVVLGIKLVLEERQNMPVYKDMNFSLKTKSLSPAEYTYDIWIPKVSGTVSRNNKGANHARAAAYMKSSGSERRSGHYVSIIKPDWIMKRSFIDPNEQSRILNIELDTGTEQWSQIEEKIWRYCIVAERNKDCKHAVVFVLPDETFSMRTKYGDRSQRIKNMYMNLEKDTKLIERMKEVNLDVGINSLKHIGRRAAIYLQPEYFEEE